MHFKKKVGWIMSIGLVILIVISSYEHKWDAWERLKLSAAIDRLLYETRQNQTIRDLQDAYQVCRKVG